MEHFIFSIVFFLIALLTGADMLIDFRKGGSAGHLLAEGVVMILGFIGALLVTWKMIQFKNESKVLHQNLGLSQAEAQRWKNEAKQLLQGLSKAIDEQFDRWKLSVAEKEVGLLLLKGLSLKEIADIRKTSERTVRQQAGELYRKAGLGNRSEFSAFFLEDLLIPSSSIN